MWSDLFLGLSLKVKRGLPNLKVIITHSLLVLEFWDVKATCRYLKVPQSLYCNSFTTSISRGVENYFPKLWGMGISDTIF